MGMNRWTWIAVLALVCCGCTVDAGRAQVQPPVSAPQADAAAVVDVIHDCPGAGSSLACVPIAPADGGYRYGCYLGVCPMGDAGACDIVSNAPATSRYAEVICERAACTRLSFADADCGGDAWQCPWARGKALAVPPGKCSLSDTPDGNSTDAAYCCSGTH